MRCALPVALAGLVALASCSVEINADDTSFRCDEQHACPPDYVCVGAGHCARPDWRCGKINVLADGFGDGSLTGEWAAVAAGGGVVGEDGQMSAAPAAGGVDPSAAYYESYEWYDWGDSRASVEVPQSLSAIGTRAFLALVFDGDDTISIAQEGDQLWFQRHTAGADVTLGSVLYDPVVHRWWALRSAEGQTRWETSADGLDWETRFQETQLETPGRARIRFGASAVAGVAAPGTARFDNLNSGVVLGHTCRAADLAEDFEGTGTDGWRRSYEEGGASRDSGDGTAVVALSDADASEAAYVSSSAYSLRDNYLTVQVLETVGPAVGVSTWLRAAPRGGGFIGTRLEQDTLYFELSYGGPVAVMGSVLYVPEQHRYWGIGHRNGEVYWSTSADGQSWNTEVTAPEPFALDALTVQLGATAAAPGGSTVARFDDVH